MSTTEQASVIIEQSEVASARSTGHRGTIRHKTANNHNNNHNDRQLKTTGFAFKSGKSLGEGKTSPIPFVIPSYASGIIFRNTDNDESPRVQIQPAIDVASKTIVESDSEESDNGHGTDSAASKSARARPDKSGSNASNSFERKIPLQTTSLKTPTTVTQATITQSEIQNNSPIQTVSTTLSPLALSQINTMPTIDYQTTSEPRYSDINKRIEILGLQAPGYAVRSDGTINSEALPPNFFLNGNTNFGSNNLNPLDIDTAQTTTTHTTHTTTPRITRTTQHQHILPTAFIPSNDNPFLLRKSKQNLNASPAPFTTFPSTTQSKAFATFPTATQSARFATVNNQNNQRNQHVIAKGFTLQTTSTNPSPFSKIGRTNPNASNGQFVNQPNSRQSKSYNALSLNTQNQPQLTNSPFGLNLNNHARLPSFAETTTTFPLSTTKRVQSFGAIPTAKAPAGFSFGSGFGKTTITTKPTQRARLVPTTNVPSTFSTIFPSKYTFSTVPTTVTRSAQPNNAAEPSIELLPPIASNVDAKSAFAPINEAGALIRTKSPAFLSSGTVNQNHQPQPQHQQQQQPNIIKPFYANNFNNNLPAKINNGLSIKTTTKRPIQYRPVFSTTTFKPTTTTPIPTTATAAAVTTTKSSFAPFVHQNQPNANAQEPYIDLLPPLESDPSSNAFEISSSAANLPGNDLLAPLALNVPTQNSKSSSNADDSSVAAAAFVHQAASGTKSNQQQSSQLQSEIDLNPFLPPIDTITNQPTVSNVQSYSENSNEYTTITLEQNPFLPQLDLNPFLPPFIFSPSENDPGFGFGAGNPPSKDDDDTSSASDETPESSNI